MQRRCDDIDTLAQDVVVKVAHLRDERNELEVPIHPDETLETPLNKKLRIIQGRNGYRYSIDAILLAHFCRLHEGNHVIDLGTGNAIIPILLATRGFTERIIGVEIQADLVDAARRNVLINGLTERIDIIHCNVRKLRDYLDRASFDVAISNPPYRSIRSGRINPHPQKAFARHEILGSLKDMARAASFLLRPRGRFHVVYPASRMVDMIVTLREFSFEPKRIQLVHSNVGEDARLVLAEAVKDGRGELKVMEPLFVYDPEGRYTPEMERIYSAFQSAP